MVAATWMHRRGAWWRVVRAFAICVGLAVPARALDEHVQLEVAAELAPELAQQVRESMAGQLADLASLEQTAGEPLCRVRVSREAQELVLVLSTAGERTERRLFAEDEQLATSELASVVRAYVIALLQRRESDRAFRLRPVVAPRLEPASAHSPGRGLSASALYTGALYAPELRWQSGLRGELSWSRGQLHVALGYGYHPPAEVRRAEARIRVSDHNLYAAIGLLRASPRLGFGAELLAGVTGTTRRTMAASMAVETGDSHYWGPALALRLRGRVRALSWLWLELMPTLELTWGRPSYDVDTGMQVRVLAPRALSGRLDVGTTFDLL